MDISTPPGRAGIIVKQLAEMVPAPRDAIVLPAFLALASALFGRRFKDGQEPTNLFLLTAAPTYAGKTRMQQALTRAVYNAQVGWDAGPAGLGLVATHGIVGRNLFVDAPWRTAGRLHAELLRTGSQCFLADDFLPTGRFLEHGSDLHSYLTHAWAAGTPSASLAQLDRRAGSFGDGSGAASVWNPCLTIWGACTPQELPDVGDDFWSRWLLLNDDAEPQQVPLTGPWELRQAFSTDVADLLRQWTIEAAALDDAYAASAIVNDDRPTVTPLQALAEIQRKSLISVTWDSHAHLAMDISLPGRNMALARRIACLIAATNGDHVVSFDVAAWACAFVASWNHRRLVPAGNAILEAVRETNRRPIRVEYVHAEASAILKAQGYVQPEPLVVRALHLLLTEQTRLKPRAWGGETVVEPIGG